MRCIITGACSNSARCCLPRATRAFSAGGVEHALEAHAGYGQALLHGEAVGAGLALAFAHSAELGFCNAEEASRVRAHLESAGLHTDLRTLPGAPYDAQQLLALMAGDKKAEAGQITLVLARTIGQAFVHKGADAAKLRAFLEGEIT